MGLPVAPVDFVGFLLASVALVVSPGPDTILIVRNTLAAGRGPGMATVAGVQLGLVIHTIAAVFGLSLLISMTPYALEAISIAGALYLAWLGVQGLRAGTTMRIGANAVDHSSMAAIRDGMLTNILNPKVLLLFLALLPNFVTPGRASIPVQLATLAVGLITINVLWQGTVALFADRARESLTSVPTQTLLSRVTSLILLLFAGLLLWEHL